MINDNCTNSNSGCRSCGNSKCDPAKYSGCNCDIQQSPYDPTQWVMVCNGMSHKINIPKLSETDTTLSTNYTNATLNYQAEAHRDVVTGAQLGDLINVEDLRDTDIDGSLEGTCYEFIYHKYADCGEGCESIADKWVNFNINSTGAQKDYLKYVRGTNDYGCPEYLTPPTNLNEYYFAGWKQDGEHNEFGYMQPKSVDTLPKDSNGNALVMSVDQTTKQPIIGPMPSDCAIRNLIANLASNVWGSFRKVQGTPGFSASMNKVTGDFTISWDDWGDVAHTKHIGHGELTGKVNWTTVFNTKTGTITWTINSVTFYRVHWDKDLGATSNIYLTIAGVNSSGAHTTVLDHYHFTGAESWAVELGVTVANGTVIADVGPQQTRSGIDFVYFLVNWSIENDEGYQQMNVQNQLTAWVTCD